MSTWKKLRTAVDIPFLAIGAVLTLYIGFAAFGFVKNSSEHYSNFILGICLMIGLLAIRNLCDERLGGKAMVSETGEDTHRRTFFWPRFIFTAIALVMSAVAMGYIRYNAVHLETTQPFFTDIDMVFGWLMTISILALTLIHWGPLLTSVICIAIIYFFFGHMIENPLFITPKYDAKFVMNYIGLGTNQGFYYLAQVAADAIYFLIIYAAILLGVGMLNMVLEVGKVTGRRISGGAAGPALIGSGIVAFLMSFENFSTTLMLVGSDAPLTITMFDRLREGSTPVLNAVSLLLMVASSLLALVSILVQREERHIGA